MGRTGKHGSSRWKPFYVQEDFWSVWKKTTMNNKTLYCLVKEVLRRHHQNISWRRNAPTIYITPWGSGESTNREAGMHHNKENTSWRRNAPTNAVRCRRKHQPWRRNAPQGEQNWRRNAPMPWRRKAPRKQENGGGMHHGDGMSWRRKAPQQTKIETECTIPLKKKTNKQTKRECTNAVEAESTTQTRKWRRNAPWRRNVVEAEGTTTNKNRDGMHHPI